MGGLPPTRRGVERRLIFNFYDYPYFAAGLPLFLARSGRGKGEGYDPHSSNVPLLAATSFLGWVLYCLRIGNGNKPA